MDLLWVESLGSLAEKTLLKHSDVPSRWWAKMHTGLVSFIARKKKNVTGLRAIGRLSEWALHAYRLDAWLVCAWWAATHFSRCSKLWAILWATCRCVLYSPLEFRPLPAYPHCGLCQALGSKAPELKSLIELIGQRAFSKGPLALAIDSNAVN